MADTSAAETLERDPVRTYRDFLTVGSDLVDPPLSASDIYKMIQRNGEAATAVLAAGGSAEDALRVSSAVMNMYSKGTIDHVGVAALEIFWANTAPAEGLDG